MFLIISRYIIYMNEGAIYFELSDRFVTRKRLAGLFGLASRFLSSFIIKG